MQCQEEGFSVFGCGVGEEDAPLYRRIEVNVGLLKRPGSHSALRGCVLRCLMLPHASALCFAQDMLRFVCCRA